MKRPLPLAAWSLALLCLCFSTACDNIGHVFDPGSKGGSGSTQGTGVEVVPVGGDVGATRPLVRAVYPKGSGWPSTVPIVVVFSQSMNQDSVVPPQSANKSPTVFLRLKGTTDSLPAAYNFLLGGKVLLIRPAAALTSMAGASYEVVIDPAAANVDGLKFGGSAPQVIAEFTPDEDAMTKDGRILTTLPEDNKKDIVRETPVYAIFTKLATVTSITTDNFTVQTSAGAKVAGAVTFPITAAGVPDSRILRFDAKSVLDGDTQFEIVVQDTIKFGDGKLDFKNKKPFAKFQTLGFEAATSVAVGNTSATFPDKVNRGNIDNLQIDVKVPASARAGDTVVARLYGLDPDTKDATDVNFVKGSASVPADGAQTVTVSLAGSLGSAAKPRFTDGAITLAAQLQRGSTSSGFIHGSASSDPRLDTTPPTLDVVGPPSSGATDIITDQEYVTFYGKASERVAQASLVIGSSTATIFGAASDGRFITQPLLLGRRSSPIGYQIVLTDAAGNMSASAFTGNVVQRGVVTGAVSGGTLVVEAYDEATLQALSGVSVVLEPGMPTKPPSGRLPVMVTGLDGRVMFTGLTQASYTITLALDGYHLKTLLATPASYVSLPLRPLANATATLAGAALFSATTGTSALVGCNVIDDPRVQAIATSTASPTAIPSTAIRPDRPIVLTAFAGLFEPTMLTTFSFAVCPMCTANGTILSPPAAPATPGQPSSQQMTLLPVIGTTLNLAASYDVDFAAAGGLDTGNLSGNPTVRIVGSLRGLPGMTLLGVGFAQAMSGASYAIQGSYSLTSALSLAPLASVLWVSTEARDKSGNLSRHRRLILDVSLGTTYPTTAAPGIPTITAPSGPFTGAPQIDYQDRLDAATLLGGHGFTEITATDPAGRQWSLLREDTDGAVGAVSLQVPDLTGTGVTGLATGTWTVRAENHLLFSVTFGTGDYVLEEMRRQQVTYARAAPATFTVN